MTRGPKRRKNKTPQEIEQIAAATEVNLTPDAEIVKLLMECKTTKDVKALHQRIRDEQRQKRVQPFIDREARKVEKVIAAGGCRCGRFDCDCAKWDRIYQEKFADKEYYTRFRPMHPQSSCRGW